MTVVLYCASMLENSLSISPVLSLTSSARRKNGALRRLEARPSSVMSDSPPPR